MPKSPLRPPIFAIAGLVLAGLLSSGCTKEENTNAGQSSPPPVTTQPVATQPAATVAALPHSVSMRIGTGTFSLEVAGNDRDREQGLMYRASMPLDHGMIFIFGTERNRVFWMRNTLIPLDIVYLNAAGTVVSIKHGEPLQEEPTIPSDAPTKWAIELNYGVAAAAGLKPGDKLTVPSEARVAEQD